MYLGDWVIVALIPCPLDKSGVLTKSTSSHILLNLLTMGKSPIVNENRKNEIAKRPPVTKHYLVHPDTVHGQMDLNTSTRRGARARLGNFIRMLLTYS